MNMIFYQGDGLSIKNSLRDMSYNYIRSHSYVMFHIARMLGCTNVLDGISGSCIKVTEGSDLYYTLKEFPEYNFKDANLGDLKNSLGILFHTGISKDNYSKLMKAITRSTYLIYYCSDFEYDDEDYCGGKMLLKFIKENPNDRLSKEFKSRCILILSGFLDVKYQIEEQGFPCIYIPQIINPNIPRVESRKFYDVWMINTNPFYKHISEKLRDDGFKVLTLVQDKNFVEGIDYVELKGGGISLDFLLSLVSMCKYYFGSYPDYESLDMSEKYSTWTHTSKVLECYYANTYWISPNKNYRQIRELLHSDQYKNQKDFNKVIKDNYSLSKFKDELNQVKEICKQFIK